MKLLSLSLDNSILDKDSPAARRMVKYGKMVEKYTVIAPHSKRAAIELSNNVKVYGAGGLSKLCRIFNAYRLAKELLKKEKYDIITVQDPYYLGFIGLKLAKRLKMGLEIQVHGFEKFFGIRKITAKDVLAKAGAVRCVSQRLKRQLVSEFKVKEERITVAPIHSELRITNLPTLPAGRQAGQAGYELRMESSADNFIFLTVGRLVSVKNIRLQIVAMAQVAKKCPNSELWIIGEGPERKKLEKLCYELRVASYVKFFGRQENLEKYYSQSDAFLLTSDSEGWGLAVIEAAGFGLPIIMTDVGCAGEVIKDQESGVVIPVGDKEKLAEAMIKIIEDEQVRGKLGLAAQQAVRTLPGEEEILKLYKRSWEKALNNK